MAADLVVLEVVAVAEAGPERGGVKQLEGLGGGRPGGQLQLEEEEMESARNSTPTSNMSLVVCTEYRVCSLPWVQLIEHQT